MRPDGKCRYSRVRLNQLERHPLQDACFAPCSEAEDRALQDDIRLNGLRQRIVVVRVRDGKDGIRYRIVQGHRRAEACAAIGMEEADVIVRTDLEDAPAHVVEAELLRDNLNRRQLRAPALGRIVRRLIEIERGREGPLTVDEERCARDRVGSMLGICGRQAWRYIRIANAPLIVQQLVDAGHLNQTLAERVEKLDRACQEELVQRLSAMDDPTAANGIVTEFLPAPRRRQKTVDPLQRLDGSTAQFVEAVNAAAASLATTHDALTAGPAPHDDWSAVKQELIRERLSAHRSTLQDTAAIIRRVLAALQPQK